MTPVYNGSQFLAECIESVVAQQYENWEYHIVDNCSTDDTLEIAESFARKDHRIHVTTNSRFVGVIENHNICCRLISNDSRYCKFVCADDVILPQCLTRMVRFAEEHPSVAIVGAHQRSGENVRWRDLSSTITVVPGRGACRLVLLQGLQIFGAPTAVLYRADVVRARDPFFPHQRPHADTSVCFEILEHCDLGLIHEILTEERVHPQQITTKIEKLGAGTLAYLEAFHDYGPRYLSNEEYVARKAEVMHDYYRYLGGCLFKLRPRKFWSFQVSRMREMGWNFEPHMVAWAAFAKLISGMRHPAETLARLLTIVRERVG